MEKNIKQKNIKNPEIEVSRSTSNGMINKQIKNNKGFTSTPSLALLPSFLAIFLQNTNI